MVLSVTHPAAAGGLHERQLRGAAQAVLRLAAGAGGGGVQATRTARPRTSASCWATSRRRRTSPRRRPRRIEGKEVTEATATAAGEAAAEGAKPLSQNGYKVKLVEVAVKRALLTAAGSKKYWEV